MDAALASGRNPGSRGFSKRTGVALLLAAAGVSLAVGIADLRTSVLYERVKVGDTITVRYLRAEPDVHALGATARQDTFMLWIAGLWLVLSGVYWLFGT